MPHVSRQPITDETQRQLSDQVVSFLGDVHAGRRKKVFKELLTRTERVMIAKRLSMLFLIHKGFPTHEISKLLRVSPSTVARFETKVEKGLYKNTLHWLKSKRNPSPILQSLFDLLAVPLEAQKKSFSQRLRELDEKRYG